MFVKCFFEINLFQKILLKLLEFLKSFFKKKKISLKAKSAWLNEYEKNMGTTIVVFLPFLFSKILKKKQKKNTKLKIQRMNYKKKRGIGLKENRNHLIHNRCKIIHTPYM